MMSKTFHLSEIDYSDQDHSKSQVCDKKLYSQIIFADALKFDPSRPVYKTYTEFFFHLGVASDQYAGTIAKRLEIYFVESDGNKCNQCPLPKITHYNVHTVPLPVLSA